MNYPLIRARELEQKIWEEKHYKIRKGELRFLLILRTEGVLSRYGVVEMALFFARVDRCSR